MTASLQERLEQAAKTIQDRSTLRPKIAIVLGSGLGPFVERLEISHEISYDQIPHFHAPTVAGHQGRLVVGTLNKVPVTVLQGRIHAYEGHDLDSVVFPVRLLRQLGHQTVVLSNASGGINTDYQPGQLVLIKDHLNLTGQNPLLGPNVAFLGERFPDMSDVYPKAERQLLKKSAQSLGLSLPEGIYAGVLGPSYETPAEVRMLRGLGADLVGMSTVPEAIAAHHAGLKVIGLSCVTNMAAGILDQKLSHDDIKDEALKSLKAFGDILEQALPALG